MNIVFLSHYFRPEGNAPASRVYELTRRWVRVGHDVTVITGVPNVPRGVPYDGYRNRWRQEETVDGVRVVRVWTYLAPNAGVLRRSLNYASFYFTAVHAAVRGLQADLLIATSPQFFCGLAGLRAARRMRVPFVLDLRDLWPESVTAVGALRPGPVIRVLGALERALYAGARRIVTVGPGYREQLLGRGVPDERIRIVPNGVDLTQFTPRAVSVAERAALGLRAPFVCGYVGTVGMAAHLDVLLDAAQILRDRGETGIEFLVAGDGAELDRLRMARDARGLDNIVMTGLLPKERVPVALAACDVCLIHLARKPLFRTVTPSKMFEAAAMERPILMAVEGVAADMVRAAGAGNCIEPENAGAIVDALLRLRADPVGRTELGRNGRRRLAEPHAIEQLARSYLDVLAEVTAG